jgi:hypothetical protein
MEISNSRQRLNAAREKLDAKDLAGAVAIYEELLVSAGDRPDVLLTISGDLGSSGHVAPIIDLIAPRYDAQRHGPAIGFNLLQAYLTVRNTDAAQHILDMLFSLNRPELEERLYGYSNAIVEAADQSAAMGTPGYLAQDVGPGDEAGAGIAEDGSIQGPGAKVALASISKPIWFYGLEPLADQILPPKDNRVRRIAFGQLAQLGMADPAAALLRPADELGRLARALPLWLAETFSFSPLYSPIAALGYLEKPDGARQPMIFAAEWMTDNLRQLMDTSKDGLDYVFTGAVRQQAGDYELVLRVWEMKKFRERKQFTARWTPSTADAELAKLHADVRQFMEWAPYPAGAGLAYAPPASPTAWLDALGASLGLFLAEKNICPPDLLAPVAPALASLAARTRESALASLAWLTLLARARLLGLETGPAEATLARDPIVAEARTVLGLD